MAPLLGRKRSLAPDLPQPQGLPVLRLRRIAQGPPDCRLEITALQLPRALLPAVALGIAASADTLDSPEFNFRWSMDFVCNRTRYGIGKDTAKPDCIILFMPCVIGFKKDSLKTAGFNVQKDCESERDKMVIIIVIFRYLFSEHYPAHSGLA